MEKRHINRNVFRLSNTYSFYYSLIGKLYYFLCLLNFTDLYISSVQFSCSVVSNSLRPHGLQHTKPPCPSPTPGAYSNSCPQSQWCHSAISSCFPLLLLPSIFPSIRVFSNELAFLIRWPKYWSFSFSISPSNEYSDWFPLGWTGWISLQSKGLSRVFSNTTVQKHQFFSIQLYSPTLTSIHDYWKNHSFDYMDLCRQNDVSEF